MATGVGVQRLLAGGEGVEQRRARVAWHQLVVHRRRNSTGTVTRAAASARDSWPTRPISAGRRARARRWPRPQTRRPSRIRGAGPARPAARASGRRGSWSRTGPAPRRGWGPVDELPVVALGPEVVGCPGAPPRPPAVVELGRGVGPGVHRGGLGHPAAWRSGTGSWPSSVLVVSLGAYGLGVLGAAGCCWSVG
jgi:hypothetical protein